MRKFLLTAIAVLAVFAVQAVDFSFADYTPDSAFVIVSCDVPGILRHPEVAKRMKDPAVASEIAAFEQKTGLRIADFGSLSVAVAEDGSVGGFVKLSKFDLHALLTGAGVKPETRMIGGRQAYMLENPKNMNAKAKESVALLQLAPDVLGWAEGDSAVQFFSAPCGHADKLVKQAGTITGKPLLWAVSVFSQRDEQGKSFDITVAASVELQGAAAEDWSFSAVLTFPNAQLAKRYKQMVPLYSNMLTAAVFNQNPELGAEVTRNFQSAVDGNQLKVSLLIPQVLAQKISAYAAKEMQPDQNIE